MNKQILVLCPDCHNDRYVQYWNTQREGYTSRCASCHARNYRHTEEEKIKISLAQIGRTSGMKGKCHSEETKLKISEGEKGCGREWSQTLETREKISNTLKGRPVARWIIDKMRVARPKEWSPESRAKASATRKKMLRDNPQMLMRLLSLPWNPSPNKPECILLDLIKPFGFKFVGGGQFHIGNMVPDFWNGDHQVVEMFGDWWHRDDNPQNRINAFAEYGYKCLVIWQSELKNPIDVVTKVQEFVNA